ncbi:hypothetical protein N172_13915 [Pantoea dispersa EGD-AAK13]|uniref:hypothetical protein n=1 Tax=Pantoea TaxID=53335 RepID=UPI0003980A4E|nr:MULTISPECIES: hypothetical protein [Pantoea]ERH61598.1 hypothetical protein N172_13915 [Pantoea dispersa EGD-AAK13]
MLSSSDTDDIDKKNILKKQGIDNESIITSQNVTAYLFDKNQIQEMVKTNEGINAVTFDEVIHSINDNNDEIYFSLVDKKNNHDESFIDENSLNGDE